MRKKYLFAILLLFLLNISLVSAQNSIDKKKLMKLEMKSYKKMKPAQIRQMKIGYEKKLKDLSTASAQAKESKRREDSLQTVVFGLQNRVKELQSELESAQSEVANAQKGVAKGYYYRVQLGAYRYFDIKSKINKGDDSFLAETVEGIDKYIVGLFFSFDEADEFKNDIRKMGITDAYVVPYKDGKRITHKEALEGIRLNGGQGGKRVNSGLNNNNISDTRKDSRQNNKKEEEEFRLLKERVNNSLSKDNPKPNTNGIESKKGQGSAPLSNTEINQEKINQLAEQARKDNQPLLLFDQSQLSYFIYDQSQQYNYRRLTKEELLKAAFSFRQIC